MIYSPRPFNLRVSCTRIVIGNYVISIAMDDSCNAKSDKLSRTEIDRLYVAHLNQTNMKECFTRRRNFLAERPEKIGKK